MSKMNSSSGLASIAKDIDRKMKLYSAAALAAGVGMLAMSHPAEGEIIVTKKNIPIPVNSYFSPPPVPVGISLNNDSVNDFSFSIYSFAYHARSLRLGVWPTEGGAVVASPAERFGNYASALIKGADVGPSAQFAEKDVTVEAASTFGYTSSVVRHRFGDWGGNPRDHFLGVKFLIEGRTHYGWVRLSVITEPSGLKATITGYAYENIPNKRIFAGAPAVTAKGPVQADNRGTAPSLGKLALGAEGVSGKTQDSRASNSKN